MCTINCKIMKASLLFLFCTVLAREIAAHRLSPEAIAAIEKNWDESIHKRETEKAAVKRSQIKNLLMSQMVSNGDSQEDAEVDAEELLETIQLAKKSVMRSMGLSEKIEPYDDGMWQTDIRLSLKQAQKIILNHGGQLPNHRGRRSVYSPEEDATLRWSTPISYYIDKSISQYAAAKIPIAMQRITAALPCLSFQQLTERPKGKTQLYMFFSRGAEWGGCGGAAPIGMMPGAVGNLIDIDVESEVKCKECDAIRVITHEIFHSLGMSHEHSRGDRDRYIKVIPTNIAPGFAFNFEQDSNDSYTPYGVDYNYKSLMHYASNVYSINGKDDTMVPVPANDLNKKAMGTQCAAEPTDFTILNRTYCQSPRPMPTGTYHVMSIGGCFSNCKTFAAPPDPADCLSGYTSSRMATSCFKCDGEDCQKAETTDDWIATYYRKNARALGFCDEGVYRAMKLRECKASSPFAPTMCADSPGFGCGWKALNGGCRNQDTATKCPKSCGTGVCSRTYL